MPFVGDVVTSDEMHFSGMLYTEIKLKKYFRIII